MPDGSVSQRTRLGKFHSPLGPDALALVRFGGDEGINQLGSFQVDALASEGMVNLDALLGLHGTVEIKTLQHGPRFYDGIITEAELIEERADGWLVQLVLRPWFWLAGLRRNQRIFHNKTAPQIIAEVLRDYAHPNDPLLKRTYQPIEYTVQYGESDLAFVCRMMEHHGISYHFAHQQAGHVMVLTDAPECFEAAPGGSRVFQPVSRQHRVEEEHFSIWSATRRVKTGRIKLTDYNFKTPTAAMPVTVSGNATHSEGSIESFDYPGVYLAESEGRGVARMRADQARGPDGLFAAQGDTASLSPGMLITLTNHPDPALNGKKYLLCHATHAYVAEAYVSGAEGSSDDSYKGQYAFHPQDKPFLPAITTAPARIYGPQTAMVVGDGQIDCDEYGRILVRFHWDLKSAHSMRCRVAQIWAGNGWGGMVIPRIGMEVLVEFLEGDPDKPLVTGCVYNGKNKVPYDLPDHKTLSTLKSDTHQGSGFNEFTIEDEKGEENMFFHAQKDHTTRILNNRTARVDKHDVYSVGGNRAIEVAKNEKHEIGGSFNLTVGGTGKGALGALAGVMGLAGQTAGLLTQAGAVAGGGGATLGAFSATLASSALGFLSGGGLGARDGVVAGGNPGTDAGKALAASGAGMGKDAKGLFPIPGIMNTVVQSFQSTSVGIAQIEQVGLSKVTNVGMTSMETVGKAKKLVVGDEYAIEVGKASMVMKKDGTIIIKGVRFHFEAEGHFQQLGKVIDLN
jgi:type VI secretion system secreted protein VgrG